MLFSNAKKGFALLLFLLAFSCHGTLLPHNRLDPLGKQEAQKIKFIENKGQLSGDNNKTLSDVLFKAEASGLNIYVTKKGLTYVFFKPEFLNESIKGIASNKKAIAFYEYERFDIDLKNSEIKKENIVAEGTSKAYYNFFYSHCKQGINSVQEYNKITIKEVYPGIDWVLYGSEEKGLKYDFIVHPGADADQIRLLYKTLDELEFDNGTINLKFPSGRFSDNAPECFLQTSGSKINSSYSVKSKLKKTIYGNTFYETEIGFSIAKYATNEILIIDPLQQWWGTYYGGNGDSNGNNVTIDSTGNLFVIGSTSSLNLPVKPYGSLAYFQGTFGGQNNGGGLGDLFILKFTNTGVLLWATYFGGSNTESGVDIKCDKAGNVFVLGETRSVDFPLKNPGGGAYYDTTNGSLNWDSDFLIAKFSNSGQYLWGTYYGGDGQENPYTITVDVNNNLYVGGTTWSPNFPVFNPGGGAFFQGTFIPTFTSGTEGAILKFSNSGQRLYATFLGGNDYEQVYSSDCDKLGNVYFCGSTASSNFYTKDPGGGAFFQSTYNSSGSNPNGFIFKLNANCQPIWSTFIGNNFPTTCRKLVCDKQDNLILITENQLGGIPTVNPGGGAYYDPNMWNAPVGICKFNTQSQVIWGTYFGSSGIHAYLPGLAIGKCNEIYLTTYFYNSLCGSCGMPLKNPGNSAYYDSTYAGQNDIFVSAFTNSGVLKWGTFFGGEGADNTMLIACDKYGNIFYTGFQGWDYYQTPAMLQTYTTNCIKNPGGSAYFQSVPTSTPFGQGFYSVIGKFTNGLPDLNLRATGCNNNDTILAQPFPGWGPYTYTWNTGANTNSITNIPTGNYTCSITDSFFGCTQDQVINFGSPSVSIVTSNSVSSLCFGQSLTLNAQGAQSYSWSPSSGLNSTIGNTVIASPSVTTTYSILGTTSSGCSSNSVITLTVNPLPVFSISGLDSICKGSTAILLLPGTNNYTWTPNIGLNTTIGSSVTASPAQTQIYTVIGKDVNGCIDSTKFNLKVIPNPTVQVSGALSFCYGQNSSLSFQGANQYTLTNGSTSFNGNQAVISPTTNTTYTLTGTNNGVCKNSMIINTAVWPLPTIILGASNDTVCAGDEIYLQCNSTGNVSWYPSSGLNCTQCPGPMAIFENSIKYYATVTNGNNCTNKDSISIFPKADCSEELIIPNVFTPNYDGTNDVFKVTASGIKEFYIGIYDRWGLNLFESDKIHNSWDGVTTSGIAVSSGTYFYIIKATSYSGKIFNLKGYLELIR